MTIMSKEEIISSYRHAKKKAVQIGIFTELNGCRKEEIISILLDAGETIPIKRRNSKYDENELNKDDTRAFLRMSKRLEELDDIITAATLEYKSIARRMGMRC